MPTTVNNLTATNHKEGQAMIYLAILGPMKYLIMLSSMELYRNVYFPISHIPHHLTISITSSIMSSHPYKSHDNSSSCELNNIL